jgi:hypothetical protein
MGLLRCIFVCVTLAVVAVAPALADDVPVQYLVDQKPLKEAVAGTQLSFSLYADSACSDLLSTAGRVVEDLVIERLALVRPKGAPKSPKVARISTFLTGVDPEGTMYLQVTGTGITPIGPACQPQVAVPQVPTPRTLTPGSASTLEAYECAFVYLGLRPENEANDVISFHVLDINDQPIPSVNNETAFVPGTLGITSQNGAIAWGQICNLSFMPKDLPEGWKTVERQF